MIQVFKKTIRDAKIRKLKEPAVGSWVYVENPTLKELERLAKKYKLEKDLLMDAIDPNEVPRVEVERGSFYVFTRIPFKDKRQTSTVPVLICLTKDFLLTVSVKPLPMPKDFYSTQKNKLFTLIFSEINTSYYKSLTEISKTIRSLSSNLRKITNRDIEKFVFFERTLNDFLAALIPIHSLLHSIASGKFFKLYEEDKDLAEDVYLASGQLIEMCKANLKNIVNIRESYSTIMTNNLNQIMKLLTALTVVLTIPTIISSFYGMNVHLPYADSPFAFLIISAFTVITSLIVLAVFIYKRWI